MLRGVLFDLDGTLGDHDGSVLTALTAWLPTVGMTADPAMVERWHTVAETHLAAWRRREIDFPEQRRRRLRDFGFAGPDAALDDVFRGYLVEYQNAYRSYDDVAEALAAVDQAGLRVAVLTNGSAAQQRAKLARMGLADLGPVWTPDDLGMAKPDPGAFSGAVARWGLRPEETLSVGDRHDLDVLAARSAGLRAVHLDRLGAGPAGEPHRIRSLRELAGHL
ncbi:putative hydrolase of the HAD superfamily [Actinoplanes octamycinicus]|uniref:Putative hydrolase of the HAD superfamily n=1 Tax=Actinoplanes octamycinicus TaxID=135948 RepID=A0A7W7M4D3_9ACTN|nr:HAD family hydrolase [Actinoplanes octamycinicus]MBB4736549.1 putative hydrolase of the HAD superfamily [Actinoplanes octamycinicus]GIE63872.1 haloacid dehalogenase [Actinoplanes octamycinicus]